MCKLTLLAAEENFSQLCTEVLAFGIIWNINDRVILQDD